MDDYSLPLSLTSHLLIAPLGVNCKFAVLNKKYKNKLGSAVSHRGRVM